MWGILKDIYLIWAESLREASMFVAGRVFQLHQCSETVFIAFYIYIYTFQRPNVYLYLFLLWLFFIVQVQLSPLSPHHTPTRHPSPPPTLTPASFGFASEGISKRKH